ncbi:phosphoglycolate phosphatase [Anaerosolibacter carboniphilus]|uniref:Phosphoglycolate phosphatase n=1 Tax=Anaerosolibacter carboniphilus TaxID=1417629 RepID=A0A841L759_9FIRM|nr:HAD family hydrolase [Anaerosolibacter carboniphilus]MBB6218912.1 phosphoglycolate phosphatase [Anaerosolibacter carboniphilus]
MDSIIFDLDGTLWDSTDVVLMAWNEVVEGYQEIENPITKEDLKSIMGLQVKEIGRKLFPSVGEDVQQEILKKCCEIECGYIEKQGGILYDHLEAVLRVLSQKYKLFIVSNCQCGYIEVFLKYHKLENYFTDFENPGRTGLSKGENIKLIMDRNNLKKPVYVGDTEGDRKAAIHAGIPFVYARYGFGEVIEFDHVIDRFDDLLKLF